MRYLILCLFLVRSIYSQNNDLMFTINQNADHKGIKTIFVLTEGVKLPGEKQSFEEYYKEKYGHYPTGYDGDKINKERQAAEQRIALWERILLKYKFNVITRDKLNVLIDEMKLSQSGLIDNSLEIGKLAKADAVLIVEENERTTTVKLISIKTGEILFNGFYRIPSIEEWGASIISEYSKIKLNETK